MASGAGRLRRDWPCISNVGKTWPRRSRYHHLAAQQAMQRSGYQEAIGHLNRGLELLQQRPDHPQRAEQELIMQLALGSALKVIKGFAAVDAEQAYLRARELCHQLGEPSQLFPVLYSLYELYEFRGAFQQARELGEQLLHLASRRDDVALILGAHEILACTTFHLGAFTQVVEHMERGITLYDREQHQTLTSLYGKDLGVACRYWSALALWFLGYPDQALQQMHEALILAQDLAHPYSLAMALDRASFPGNSAGRATPLISGRTPRWASPPSMDFDATPRSDRSSEAGRSLWRDRLSKAFRRYVKG